MIRRRLRCGNLLSRHAVRPTSANGAATNAHTRMRTLTFTVANAEILHGWTRQSTNRKHGLQIPSLKFPPIIRMPLIPKFGTVTIVHSPTGLPAVHVRHARSFHPRPVERLPVSITKTRGSPGSRAAGLELVVYRFHCSVLRHTERRTMNNGRRKTAKCRSGSVVGVRPKMSSGTSNVKFVIRHNDIILTRRTEFIVGFLVKTSFKQSITRIDFSK